MTKTFDTKKTFKTATNTYCEELVKANSLNIDYVLAMARNAPTEKNIMVHVENMIKQIDATRATINETPNKNFNGMLRNIAKHPIKAGLLQSDTFNNFTKLQKALSSFNVDDTLYSQGDVEKVIEAKKGPSKDSKVTDIDVEATDIDVEAPKSGKSETTIDHAKMLLDMDVEELQRNFYLLVGQLEDLQLKKVKKETLAVLVAHLEETVKQI